MQKWIITKEMPFSVFEISSHKPGSYACLWLFDSLYYYDDLVSFHDFVDQSLKQDTNLFRVILSTYKYNFLKGWKDRKWLIHAWEKKKKRILDPGKLKSMTCQEGFFNIMPIYCRNLFSFAHVSGGQGFISNQSVFCLIMQHTDRNVLSDRINHMPVTSSSIAAARTIQWELSTTSLKSTRCII